MAFKNSIIPAMHGFVIMLMHENITLFQSIFCSRNKVVLELFYIYSGNTYSNDRADSRFTPSQ